MSPALRALIWKEGKSLRSSLLVAPFFAALFAWLWAEQLDAFWADQLLLSIGPVVAAIAGAAAFAGERTGGTLAWLRARAVAPEWILLVKLAWGLVLLFLLAGGTWVVVFKFSWVGWLGWSEMLDVPMRWTLPIAALLWLTAFGWATGLSWLSDSKVGGMMGAVLLCWLQAFALLFPGGWIGGRPDASTTQWPWLVPGFLGPPLLLAAWAYRRWDPLRLPWSRARLAVGAVVVVLVAVGAFLPSLAPAREMQRLRTDLSSASSVTSHANPERPDFVAHDVVLPSGATRVVFDGGRAEMIVLPEGTRFAGWTTHAMPRAVVLWPHGRSRMVPPHGHTEPAVNLTEEAAEFLMREIPLMFQGESQ